MQNSARAAANLNMRKASDSAVDMNDREGSTHARTKRHDPVARFIAVYRPLIRGIQPGIEFHETVEALVALGYMPGSVTQIALKQIYDEQMRNFERGGAYA